VRTALLTVAVGPVGAVGVAASGWALQASALPPPKPAARIGADTSTWFQNYRLVVDVFHTHHRTIKGACPRGWFPGPGGPKIRASLLSLRRGAVLLLSGRSVSLVGRRRNRLHQPPVAIGDADGREVTARLYLTRVTRTLLARFHMLAEAELGRTR